MADELVGPLSNVESLLIRGEHDRHDAEIKRLEETHKNLAASVKKTLDELKSIRDRQSRMLIEILKGRGKDPGTRATHVVRRPDGTTWISIGG